MLAIANKDLNMLTELWNLFGAWNEYHFLKIVKLLINDKWSQGL